MDEFEKQVPSFCHSAYQKLYQKDQVKGDQVLSLVLSAPGSSHWCSSKQARCSASSLRALIHTRLGAPQKVNHTGMQGLYACAGLTCTHLCRVHGCSWVWGSAWASRCPHTHLPTCLHVHTWFANTGKVLQSLAHVLTCTHMLCKHR